jgi:hypothetical protein
VIDIAPFVLGVVLGTLITAFSAVGSHGRGYDSVRRGAWRRELVERKRAVKAATAARVAVDPALQPGLRKAS